MTVPIPTSLPITSVRRVPRPPRDLWRTFAECGEVHEGPSHDRPTRPQCAGHERERDEK